jgi:hypothetical protein
MDTTENNKLIAEFMGGKIKEFNPLFGSKFKEIDTANMECYISLPKYVNPKALKYHISWDWLMPVVEKIEGTETENGYYEVRPFIDRTEILDDHFQVFIEVDGNDRQKNTYEAVVEFIKWYNENK